MNMIEMVLLNIYWLQNCNQIPNWEMFNKFITQIIKMKSKNYIGVEKIGEGSFAVVERVRSLIDGQQYAMKRVKYAELKQKNKRNALNEIHILSLLDHPNVIGFKQSFFDQTTQNLCTVMQLAFGGDLAHRIKTKAECSQFFTEEEVWKIGKDLVNGISALHQKNIIHRDIKPANILFGLKDIAKIGDLNVSIELKNHLVYTQTGTPFYASPEVWSHEPYSFECDIWSFGCVLYEMCMLRKPFESHSVGRLHMKINKLKYEPVSNRFSAKMHDLIDRCLQFKPYRIGLAELKKIFHEHHGADGHQVECNAQIIRRISFDFDEASFMYPCSSSMKKREKQNRIKLEYQQYGKNEKTNDPTTISSIQNKFESVLDKYLVSQRRLPSSNRSINRSENSSKQEISDSYGSCKYLRSGRVITENNICSVERPTEYISWQSRKQLARQESNIYRWRSQYRSNYLLY